MPRIVSLIASATEIVCALGFEDQLVGRSHECDFPDAVRRLPVCTTPRFDISGSSADIDRRVRDTLTTGLSVYEVHTEVLQSLKPDVIVTQMHCDVCAVSARDVETAVSAWVGTKPRIVSLLPNCLDDVWTDIRRTAEALAAPERGESLVNRLQQQMAQIAERAGTLPRVSVACIEWIEPLMAAGNWMPELVEQAGAFDLFGTAGKHSPNMTFEQLRQRDPDAIIVQPCGFDLERTRQEMPGLLKQPGWEQLRAVQARRVYLADGNQFFNRPGPRLLESLEILAEILHPEQFHFGHEGRGWHAQGEPASVSWRMNPR